MSENGKRKRKNSRQIIDLRRYINPEMMNVDDNGSYTGVTRGMLYDADTSEELPVQDADDL